MSFLGSLVVGLPNSEISSNSNQYETITGNQTSQNKILIINVEGVILNEAPSNDFLSLLSGGVTYGYEVKDQLIQASTDANIKAVIIKVNSPGGTITGSQAIADGIKYFKTQTGKKVYGFGSGVVASGGYWSLLNTDKIFIDHGSVIGSIGVIAGELVYYDSLVAADGFVTKNGINVEYITAGEGKDLGSPFRKPTAKEREILQKSADNLYDVFVDFVSERRGISKNKIKSEIGAHVYEEYQAKDLGLIDVIANRDDAYNMILSELNISDDFQIVTINNQINFFSSLFGVAYRDVGTMQFKNQLCESFRQPVAYWGDVASVCAK